MTEKRAKGEKIPVFRGKRGIFLFKGRKKGKRGQTVILKILDN